ncbi:hypothetical protein VPHD292_0093 [Vibrio phage D292]
MYYMFDSVFDSSCSALRSLAVSFVSATASATDLAELTTST